MIRLYLATIAENSAAGIWANGAEVAIGRQELFRLIAITFSQCDPDLLKGICVQIKNVAQGREVEPRGLF